MIDLKTELYDFNNLQLSHKNGTYGGIAGNKDGVIINGENWMIKYPKNTKSMKNVAISYTTAPLCEYIGSHIYGMMGYNVHQTLLGERNHKIVVACKDFCEDGSILMEMRTIKNFANPSFADYIDSNFSPTEKLGYVNLDETLMQLKHNDILTAIPDIEKYFWNMSVVDLFIGNNDRNYGNWGLLRLLDGTDVIAPIFDNGGCFTDKLGDDRFVRMLNDPEKLRQSAINYRTTYGYETKDGIKQLNAKDFLQHCMRYPGFCEALTRNYEIFQNVLCDVKTFIQKIPEEYHGLPVCSQANKQYLCGLLEIRSKELLQPAYEQAKNILLKEEYKQTLKNIVRNQTVPSHENWNREVR